MLRKLPAERCRELHPLPKFLVMAEAYIEDVSFAYETSLKSRNSTIEFCFFNAAALLSISGGENFEIYGLINMPTHPSEGSRLANYYQNDKHSSRDWEIYYFCYIHLDFPFIYSN